MTTLRHSIIGLPESGKTTFLAALWHLLSANEVKSKFTLDKHIGDTSHLNAIAEAWRKCEKVPRTSLAAEKNVSIHVKELESGKSAILHFPDLSGESFELQLRNRACSIDYIERLNETGGILLFITADRPSDGLSILDFPWMAEENPEDETPEEHHEWDSEMVSTQVKLVDLLQFLDSSPFRPRARRLAVIVSAWDVIDTQDLTPESWLERELPLLHQYLTSNPDSFDFQIYGVSAQGGDVTSEIKMELLSKVPSTRIMCIGSDTDHHDLTSPIAWLMPGE